MHSNALLLAHTLRYSILAFHVCGVLLGMLCIGAYPEGQADATSRVVTSHSSAIAQLLMKGLDTFVCLMTDDEVERPNGVPYEVGIQGFTCSRWRHCGRR